MAPCTREQPGCSGAAAGPWRRADNEKKPAANSKPSQAWKSCFSLPPSQKLQKGSLIKHFEFSRHLSLCSLWFYGTHHSPSFPPLHAQVATDSFEGMDQCFCKTENATKMLQVKGIKASPSLGYFKDAEILLYCQVTASAVKCQTV